MFCTHCLPLMLTSWVRELFPLDGRSWWCTSDPTPQVLPRQNMSAIQTFRHRSSFTVKPPAITISLRIFQPFQNVRFMALAFPQTEANSEVRVIHHWSLLVQSLDDRAHGMLCNVLRDPMCERGKISLNWIQPLSLKGIHKNSSCLILKNPILGFSVLMALSHSHIATYEEWSFSKATVHGAVSFGIVFIQKTGGTRRYQCKVESVRKNEIKTSAQRKRAIHRTVPSIKECFCGRCWLASTFISNLKSSKLKVNQWPFQEPQLYVPTISNA